MILNRYEESPIPNPKLPASWQSQEALSALEDFLQKIGSNVLCFTKTTS